MPKIGGMVGRFLIEHELGVGGMGKVFKGKDTKLDLPVAIKQVDPVIVQHPSGLSTFRSEAKIAVTLHHPNIVGFVDFVEIGPSGKPPKELYLVTNFVVGKTLQEWVNEKARQGNLFTQDEAIDIALQVLDGLAYSHSRGVIHRDMKPSNVMFDGQTAIIIDFGIARNFSNTSLKTQFLAQGAYSHFYSAPEQRMGTGTTPQSDLYSVGVILYDLLTGSVQQVFPMDPLVRLQADPLKRLPHVSSQMEQVILRSVAVMPQSRYLSAQEFGNALKALKGGPQSISSPLTPPSPIPSGTVLTTQKSKFDIRKK